MRCLHLDWDEMMALVGGQPFNAQLPSDGPLWTRLHAAGFLMDMSIYATMISFPRRVQCYQATNAEEAQSFPSALGLGVIELAWKHSSVYE